MVFPDAPLHRPLLLYHVPGYHETCVVAANPDNDQDFAGIPFTSIRMLQRNAAATQTPDDMSCPAGHDPCSCAFNQDLDERGWLQVGPGFPALVIVTKTHRRSRIANFTSPPERPRSRQTPAGVDRFAHLARVGSVLGIPLIAVEVELIIARRLPDRLVALERLHPPLPATARLGLRPAAVGLQHRPHAHHPRRNLDVHERHLGAEEIWASGIRGVDELRDRFGQFRGEARLLAGLLRLEVAVEGRDDVPVDVVGPEARVGAQSGVAGQQGGAALEVFEVLHQHGAFVGAPVAVAESGDEAAWVDVEQEFRFAVDLVRERSMGDPHSVHKRTEARSIELQFVVDGMCLGGLPSLPRSLLVICLFLLVAALVGVKFWLVAVGGHVSFLLSADRQAVGTDCV
nr:hypothetical protein CFP56_00718 [Quercus suber]